MQPEVNVNDRDIHYQLQHVVLQHKKYGNHTQTISVADTTLILLAHLL